ncbi:MAG: hypothetical protein NTV56_20340 [Alphaproteobacteria bacterium]|nr:hypothetical protein [Alphaproteobacteria bacterium]
MARVLLRIGVGLCARFRRAKFSVALAAVFLAVFSPSSSRAQDATWANPATQPGAGGIPGTFAFSSDVNWTNPATTPTGTAFFGTSSTTSIQAGGGPLEIGGWTFNNGASAYSFTINSALYFNGAGIVINGGSADITTIAGGEIQFRNGSIAGSAIVNNNSAVSFSDTATAGDATIKTNNGAATR